MKQFDNLTPALEAILINWSRRGYVCWTSFQLKAERVDAKAMELADNYGTRLPAWKRQDRKQAAIQESTIADILWHSRPTMTHHYTVAQVVEIHAALEKIKDDSGRWNISLAMLKREQEATGGGASPPKVPRQRKTG